MEPQKDLGQKAAASFDVPLAQNTWSCRVSFSDGIVKELRQTDILAMVEPACKGVEDDIEIDLIMQEFGRNVFDKISLVDLHKALVMAACTFIERDPAYSTVAARLLRVSLLTEVLGFECAQESAELDVAYRQSFIDGIKNNIKLGYLDSRLQEFDLDYLASKLHPNRDGLIEYMGMQTLVGRYFLKHNSVRTELPQHFWMRIAMGLSLHEDNPEECALEFYEIISSLRYLPSTPTLFHAGYPVAQLSSCYLNTVHDDLQHIFKVTGDNAQLSKWAGGIGTDWTNIRGTGSFIKSIKATSQGVVPYLKISNDVVVAITRSGIRRGGTCAYLEVWHWDIEDFLDLRRNTGDDRRRTHDLNTATWIPDLFMKRVHDDEVWTLFSPDEAPDLHHTYGKEFEKRYCAYEELAMQGKMRLSRQIPAKQLWRKMLTRLFETGHPWITFKDPCNLRSPQDHVGVVNSSNLCTEITLNTNENETAVCNLGSINCGRHVENGELQCDKLQETVRTAIRMLDNVIDLNFYPTQEAKESNKQHRPIGMGIMGFQDALYKMGISFADEEARDYADRLMEQISYNAIEASCDLAIERGAYPSFKGSKWDRGIFPLDTLDILEKERGVPVEVNRKTTLPWDALKKRVKQHGLRNSNLMAAAPTATIATIAGCYPTIEPIYKNIYVKSNVSGEFTVLNAYLVKDLKVRGLWDEEMRDLLKYHDGNCDKIERIPDDIKHKYKTAFKLDPEWLIDITAARGKWIDQSQSHNVFLEGVSGKKMDALYRRAWRAGLKSTYYLRTLGATQIEKSTLDAGKYGFTQKRSAQENEGSKVVKRQACALNPAECESCQ